MRKRTGRRGVGRWLAWAGGLAAAILMLGGGCRSAEVTVVLREQAITGASALKVLNNSDYTTRVFFDGAFIGNVERDSSRQWRVPEGEHTVRMETVQLKSERLVKRYEFQPGHVWICAVSWDEMAGEEASSGRLTPGQ